MVYSKILELINGIPRTVDLSTNTLSLQGLQINAATGGGALTQAAHSATTSYTIIWPAAQAASSGYALINDGAGNLSWASAASGSVTSVALADGSTSPIYTISGSPVTSSGTLTFTLNTQSANTVLAGPSTGAAAQPTFRGLVSADIPNNAANTSGTASNITATSNSTLTTLSALTTASSLASIGTITSGVWNGTAIGPTFGGTGLSSYTTGDTLYASATNVLSALSIGSSGQVLTVSGGVPTWAAPSVSPGSIALTDNHILVGNASNLAADVAMSGDATIVASGALTLATVNGNVGSFGSSTSIPSITVNAKGLITAASGNAVVAPAGTLSGTTLNSTVVTSSLTSLGTQASSLNMGSNQINGLASPSVSTDAATKGYVDAAISGLTWKGPVQAYANSNVPLTGSTPLVIDGYTVLDGDLLLLAGQTIASQDGEYSAAITGGSYVLTANGLPNAVGDAWLVLNGTVFANSAFVATAAVPAATFVEFAGPTAYTFSPPLMLSGNTVSITQSTTSTNGYLSSTDWNTFNNKQASGNYITALTGDATASGPGSVALTLATVNSNIGTFASVTVNAKGLVTAAAALSGDATTSGAALTLATVNGNVGSFGSSTSIPSFTVNAKGLITAASGNAVVAPAGTLSGTTLNSTVVSSSLTSVGTITSGTWNGTTIAIANGGTGQTSAAAAYNALSPMTTTGDIEYEVSANTAARLPIGSTGQVLTVVSGAPAWASPAASTGVTTILVAGQNFTSTNTTYVVRWGLTANSETANRIYACDTTTSSFDLFYAIGTISVGGSSITSGSNATVTRLGSITLGSSDPSLTAVGSPVFLASGGALTQTAPTSAGTAVTRVGILSSTTALDVSPVAVSVN